MYYRLLQLLKKCLQKMVDYPLASSEDVLNRSVDRYTKTKFPVYRFVPGLHPHPVNSPDGHSYGSEDEEILKWNSDHWRQNEDYLYGCLLYTSDAADE